MHLFVLAASRPPSLTLVTTLIVALIGAIGAVVSAIVISRVNARAQSYEQLLRDIRDLLGQDVLAPLATARAEFAESLLNKIQRLLDDQDRQLRKDLAHLGRRRTDRFEDD